MMLASMSDLRMFVAIAEHQSFRAAARTLGVSPSALSHAMRGLEERLDVRLFNRTTRSVSLTEAGERLLNRVRPSLADLEDAVMEVASSGSRPSGSLRISASQSGATILTRHVLPEFCAAYPCIRVEVASDSRLVDIVADGFDAGVRPRDLVPRDMVAVSLGLTMKAVLVASPTYLGGQAAPISPQDLSPFRCIYFRIDNGGLLPWTIQKDSQTISLDVRDPLIFSKIELVLEAVRAGIGIGLVPEHLVEDDVASGRLIRLLDGWSQGMDELCLYYTANRHPPAALRLFVDAVRRWVQHPLERGYVSPECCEPRL